MAQPVEQRGEAFRLRPVENLPSLGTIGDEAGLLQGFEVLRDGTLSDSAGAGQLEHVDLPCPGDALEHGATGRIGKSAHDGIDAGGLDHDF